MRAKWAVAFAAAAILVGTTGLNGSDPGAGDVEDLVQGGRNLRWCVQGIRWWAEGHVTGNHLESLAGGVVAYVSCR